MDTPEEKFGELCVRELRDAGIKHFDMLAAGRYAAKGWQPLQERLAPLDDQTRELIRQCVISAIECSLDAYLQALGDRAVAVLIDGKYVTFEDLEGRMWGTLGREGWIRKFSDYPDEPHRFRDR